MDPRFLDALQDRCRAWAAAVRPLSTGAERMAFFRDALPPLALERGGFEALLDAMAQGGLGAALRQETLFDNELVLYRDPGRLFSLRLYLFGPGERTPVHDHTSWGVVSSAFGLLAVSRYRREDDGSIPGRARLGPPVRLVLRPGEIETTLPLDAGIHRTGNPGEGVTLMLAVYGAPLRRLYIQRFDPDAGTVERLFSPRVRKKWLVEQALAALRRDR